MGSRQRSIAHMKPNCVFVSECGEVDAGCEGKNAWDEAVRDLVPKILDVSVVDWAQQKPQSVKRLRDALDNEFEYLGNPLSMVGFRTCIIRFLKSERSCLKARYLKGVDTPLVHCDPEQWSRLIKYWQTDSQKQKAQKMAVARQSVKNYTLVGRKGKGIQDLETVSGTPPFHFQN